VEETPIVTVCIRRPNGTLHRSGPLTPYFTEILSADLRRAKTCHAWVVVRADAAALDLIRRRLVPLGAPGVRIVFRRERSAA